MTTTHSPAILKGPAFASRLGEVSRDPIVLEPLANPKYRNILIPGLLGGEVQFALLGLTGQALRIRGATVTALMCDRFLPACTLRKAEHHESACSRWCHRNAGPFARALKLPHRWYSQFLSAGDTRTCDRVADELPDEELVRLEHDGLALGPLIRASIESYFKVGRFDPDDPAMVGKAREFARAALYLAVIGDRALDELNIDKVLMEDGRKIDWGVIRAVALRRGIPVDVMQWGLRGFSVRVECDRPGAPVVSMPLWRRWRDQPLTAVQQRRLDEYLARRASVPYEYRDSVISVTDPAEARSAGGLPGARPGRTFAIFPNISFDAGRTRTTAAFQTAIDWVVATVRFFEKWPDHQLIVKAHPDEVCSGVRDPILPALRARVQPLPANVCLLAPETSVSAHSVIGLADIVLVYTSTTAAEAAALGKPVILVGGGIHSDRGVTMDVATPQAYEALLESICRGNLVPSVPLELARRYAYSLFFRADIPVRCFGIRNLDVEALHIESLNDLAPGRDPSMDIVCRGVLRDEPIAMAESDEATNSPRSSWPRPSRFRRRRPQRATPKEHKRSI